MPRAAQNEVQAILGPYHGRVRRVVQNAWDDCRKVSRLKADAGIPPTLYRRTLANDVFDAMARHAITEFGSDDKVTLKVEAQTIKLIFKGELVARFKKGDSNKLGQNIATQAALAFANPEGEIPGLPQAAKVEFIWISNEIQTQLEHVLVVARDNNRLLWDYEIEAQGDSAAVIPLPPQTPPPDADDGHDDLVKPKKDQSKKKKTE